MKYVLNESRVGLTLMKYGLNESRVGLSETVPKLLFGSPLLICDSIAMKWWIVELQDGAMIPSNEQRKEKSVTEKVEKCRKKF